MTAQQVQTYNGSTPLEEKARSILCAPQTVFTVSLYSVGTHALFSICSSLAISHAHCAFPRKPFSKENTPHSQLSASISFLKIPRTDLMSFLPVFFIWCVLYLTAAEDQTYALTVCHKGNKRIEFVFLPAVLTQLVILWTIVHLCAKNMFCTKQTKNYMVGYKNITNYKA